MRLNIFYADTTEAANDVCIGAIGSVPKNKNISVIIPDRFSLSVEKDIFQKLNLRSSFNIDVVSFSRFAQKLSGTQKTFLSKEGTVMLMKKAIKSLDGELSYFRKFNSIGFAKEMFAALASVRSSGVTPDILRSLAEKNELRKEKFQDMALILETYEKALAESYHDTVSRLDALTDAIEKSTYIPHSHIFILGFNIFSKQQKQVILRLIRYAESVTLCGVKQSVAGSYEFPAREIKFLAEEMGAEIIEKYANAKLAVPFNILHKGLFSHSAIKVQPYSGNNIRLFRCKTPELELVAAAREIRRLTKEGLRYRDIAVALLDDSYLIAVKRVFTRFNIPYFSDEGYNASNSALFKFISLIMEAEMTSLRRDKIIQLAKHPYLGIPAGEWEEFENYCLKYNINHTRFLEEFTLGEADKAEKVRKSILPAVRLQESGSTEEIILDILDKVKKYHKPLEGGDILIVASAQCEERIITLLNEIAALLGEEESSMEEIYSIFTAGVYGFEIKLAPQNLDNVFIGNTGESRFSGIKALFVVGASDGFFPRKASEQTIITNTDFALFERAGVAVQPTPIESNHLEQFVVSDLVCRAEKLYISYSLYTHQGEKKSESEGLKGIKRLLSLSVFDSAGEGGLPYFLGSTENAYYEYLSGDIPSEHREAVRAFLLGKGYTFFEESSVTSAGERLEECFTSSTRTISPPTLDAKSSIADSNSGAQRSSSVSQLERYFTCPFSHFLSYGLRLKEREEPKLKVADIGNIIHKALELYFKRTLGKIKSLSEEALGKIAVECAEEALESERLYASSPSSVEQNTFNRLKNECLSILDRLTQRAKKSLFQPEFIELAFGYEQPCRLGGLNLRGKVDRVDTCDKKTVVIDYKTGKAGAETSYAHIYYGKKIQPYVYLKALTERGYLPAGAVYLPLTDGYSSAGADYRYKGQLEHSLETQAQLDTDFGEAIKSQSIESSAVFNVKTKMNKQGDYFLSPTTNLLSCEEFYKFCEYADLVIEKAAEEISSGYIAPSPLQVNKSLPCGYCAFASFCEETKREIRIAGKTSQNNILAAVESAKEGE